VCGVGAVYFLEKYSVCGVGAVYFLTHGLAAPPPPAAASFSPTWSTSTLLSTAFGIGMPSLAMMKIPNFEEDHEE
jgi:hypothetical protein